jgi:hypothetical protein
MVRWNDFETHPLGTTTELRLSRSLAREMEQVMQSYGRGIFPVNVLKAYDELNTHYQWEIENEYR